MALSSIAVLAGLCGAVAIDLYLIVTESLVLHNATPILVMQWDASNVLGMAAYQGGWGTAIFGTLLHFVVSIVWGGIFVAAALRLPALRRNAYLSGTVLGLVAMGVMRVVIHFGHALVRPYPSPVYFVNLVIAHVVFFGIPVALTALSLLRDRSGAAT